MKTRPTRQISVTATPVNIRKTAAFANDPNAFPVTGSILRYASGGATLELVPFSNSVYGDGQKIDADTNYNDISQAVNRYVVASAAGPTTLRVTDYEA